MAVAGVQAWRILWHCDLAHDRARSIGWDRTGMSGLWMHGDWGLLDCLIYGGMLTKDFVILTPTRAIMTLSATCCLLGGPSWGHTGQI